jgi:Ca2+/Na+ antiporter
LISFAAGAADVFAGMSASKDAEVEGIQLGLGVLLGSSLFILAMVAVACIFASPTDIKLNKNFFIRDAIFLMAVLALLWYAVYMKGVIDTGISISMITMYGVYAVVVLI